MLFAALTLSGSSLVGWLIWIGSEIDSLEAKARADSKPARDQMDLGGNVKSEDPNAGGRRYWRRVNTRCADRGRADLHATGYGEAGSPWKRR